MQDKIFMMFFEKSRWEYAIEKGVRKHMVLEKMRQCTKKEVRAALSIIIQSGEYEISPPHTAQIPKPASPGEYRTVYVNENVDRIMLSIANDLLFELCPEMIHSSCKSYLKGVGCGKVVKEVSRMWCEAETDEIGFISDLSKYFDSVPIKYIDECFDTIEKKHGHSCVIDMIRKYYHSDLYYDDNKKLCSKYQSLKQGCSVASFLADAILYHIDEKMSSLDGYYCRYCDDMIFVGRDYKKAMYILSEELEKMQMTLNPKKVKYLHKGNRYRFLGYTVNGSSISLAKDTIRILQKEIDDRSIKRKTTPVKALNSIYSYLYKGNGEYSWATRVLSVCNSEKDIDTINGYILDCIRAVATGKKKIGGLYYVSTQKDWCIGRSKGRNVRSNREKTEKIISEYKTVRCMQRLLQTSRDVYNATVSMM